VYPYQVSLSLAFQAFRRAEAKMIAVNQQHSRMRPAHSPSCTAISSRFSHQLFCHRPFCYTRFSSAPVVVLQRWRRQNKAVRLCIYRRLRMSKSYGCIAYRTSIPGLQRLNRAGLAWLRLGNIGGQPEWVRWLNVTFVSSSCLWCSVCTRSGNKHDHSPVSLSKFVR